MPGSDRLSEIEDWPDTPYTGDYNNIPIDSINFLREACKIARVLEAEVEHWKRDYDRESKACEENARDLAALRDALTDLQCHYEGRCDCTHLEGVQAALAGAASVVNGSDPQDSLRNGTLSAAVSPEKPCRWNFGADNSILCVEHMETLGCPKGGR